MTATPARKSQTAPNSGKATSDRRLVRWDRPVLMMNNGIMRPRRRRVRETMGRGRILMAWRTFAVLALLAAFFAAPLSCTGRLTHVPWSDLRERYFIGFLKTNPVTATNQPVLVYISEVRAVD